MTSLSPEPPPSPPPRNVRDTSNVHACVSLPPCWSEAESRVRLCSEWPAVATKPPSSCQRHADMCSAAVTLSLGVPAEIATQSVSGRIASHCRGDKPPPTLEASLRGEVGEEAHPRWQVCPLLEHELRSIADVSSLASSRSPRKSRRMPRHIWSSTSNRWVSRPSRRLVGI
jgi:hypothetical protein